MSKKKEIVRTEPKKLFLHIAPKQILESLNELVSMAETEKDEGLKFLFEDLITICLYTFSVTHSLKPDDTKEGQN